MRLKPPLLVFDFPNRIIAPGVTFSLVLQLQTIFKSSISKDCHDWQNYLNLIGLDKLNFALD